VIWTRRLIFGGAVGIFQMAREVLALSVLLGLVALGLPSVPSSALTSPVAASSGGVKHDAATAPSGCASLPPGTGEHCLPLPVQLLRKEQNDGQYVLGDHLHAGADARQHRRVRRHLGTPQRTRQPPGLYGDRWPERHRQRPIWRRGVLVHQGNLVLRDCLQGAEGLRCLVARRRWRRPRPAPT
jgi:hypothetical protein